VSRRSDYNAISKDIVSLKQNSSINLVDMSNRLLPFRTSVQPEYRFIEHNKDMNQESGYQLLRSIRTNSLAHGSPIALDEFRVRFTDGAVPVTSTVEVEEYKSMEQVSDRFDSLIPGQCYNPDLLQSIDTLSQKPTRKRRKPTKKNSFDLEPILLSTSMGNSNFTSNVVSSNQANILFNLANMFNESILKPPTTLPSGHLSSVLEHPDLMKTSNLDAHSISLSHKMQPTTTADENLIFNWLAENSKPSYVLRQPVPQANRGPDSGSGQMNDYFHSAGGATHTSEWNAITDSNRSSVLNVQNSVATNNIPLAQDTVVNQWTPFQTTLPQIPTSNSQYVVPNNGRDVLKNPTVPDGSIFPVSPVSASSTVKVKCRRRTKTKGEQSQPCRRYQSKIFQQGAYQDGMQKKFAESLGFPMSSESKNTSERRLVIGDTERLAMHQNYQQQFSLEGGVISDSFSSNPQMLMNTFQPGVPAANSVEAGDLKVFTASSEQAKRDAFLYAWMRMQQRQQYSKQNSQQNSQQNSPQNSQQNSQQQGQQNSQQNSQQPGQQNNQQSSQQQTQQNSQQNVLQTVTHQQPMMNQQSLSHQQPIIAHQHTPNSGANSSRNPCYLTHQSQIYSTNNTPTMALPSAVQANFPSLPFPLPAVPPGYRLVITHRPLPSSEDAVPQHVTQLIIDHPSYLPSSSTTQNPVPPQCTVPTEICYSKNAEEFCLNKPKMPQLLPITPQLKGVRPNTLCLPSVLIPDVIPSSERFSFSSRYETGCTIKNEQASTPADIVPPLTSFKQSPDHISYSKIESKDKCIDGDYTKLILNEDILKKSMIAAQVMDQNLQFADRKYQEKSNYSSGFEQKLVAYTPTRRLENPGNTTESLLTNKNGTPGLVSPMSTTISVVQSHASARNWTAGELEQSSLTASFLSQVHDPSPDENNSQVSC